VQTVEYRLTRTKIDTYRNRLRRNPAATPLHILRRPRFCTNIQSPAIVQLCITYVITYHTASYAVPYPVQI